MSISEKEKAKRYDQTHRVIEEFTGQNGHDACWLYPNLLLEIAKIQKWK